MRRTPAGLAALAVIFAAARIFRTPERTRPMPRSAGLLAAAGLAWSATASHNPLRSRRSFAQ
jgi:hypothetical protein